jgi:hypothetical protein
MLTALLVFVVLIFVVVALGRKIFWITISCIVAAVLIIAAIGAIGTPSNKHATNSIIEPKKNIPKSDFASQDSDLDPNLYAARKHLEAALACGHLSGKALCACYDEWGILDDHDDHNKNVCLRLGYRPLLRTLPNTDK